MLRFSVDIEPDPDRRVRQMDVTWEVRDASGTGWVADLILAGGEAGLGWHGHPDEMVDDPASPTYYFNAVVRGGGTLVVPNRGEVARGVDVTVEAADPMPALVVASEAGARASRALAPATRAVLNGRTDRRRELDGSEWATSRLPYVPPVDGHLNVDTGDPALHATVLVTLDEAVDGPAAAL